AEGLLDLHPVFYPYDRTLVNGLVAVFLESDVVVSRLHLNFHRSRFLQRSAVDDHLRALGVALYLDTRFAGRSTTAKKPAHAAAHDLDVVGAARHHQAGRIACRLPGS